MSTGLRAFLPGLLAALLIETSGMAAGAADSSRTPTHRQPIATPQTMPASALQVEDTAQIDVVTIPVAVAVWVDGTYLGVSPIIVGALPVGRHTITLTKSGWQTQEFSLDVHAGEEIFSPHTLQLSMKPGAKRFGKIVLRGQVAAGSVSIDGQKNAHVGEPIVLAQGEHVIVATVRGQAIARRVLLNPDTVDVLDLDAERISENTGLVAPADQSLPDGSTTVEGAKIVIRCEGHLAVGHVGDEHMRLDGQSMLLDPRPVYDGNRLYLPVAAIEQLARACGVQLRSKNEK
jgi:hypothetical protein